ncbi:MAG: hypothetical protein C1943_04960 [Halochromatium sp.]|nr:hypothetical protein [Halochromatium sp.]
MPDRRETGPIAPDLFVVFGRPKGRRGSYRQWEEDGIAPRDGHCRVMLSATSARLTLAASGFSSTRAMKAG